MEKDVSRNKDKNYSKHIKTQLVHTDRELNQTAAISPPIWQTTTFAAESAEHFLEIATANTPSQFYTRYGNPTHRQVTAIMAKLEGGEAALVTSSGMGAIFAAVMSLLQQGDHLIVQHNHYAGTTALFRDLLPRWGIECSYVDQTQINEFATAIRPNTKLIYVETPANPLMQITDLSAIAKLAKEHQITTIVDNTFATPSNQQPLCFGIDAVVHSATKYLGGHHDVTAGIIVASESFITRAWKFSLVAGAVLSPFDGWLLLRGLRTLGLRIEQQNQTALTIARQLQAHAKVKQVYYPGLETHPQYELACSQMRGFTGMLSIELTGGATAAEQFISHLHLARRAASLGGFETLVVHPAAMWKLQLSPTEQAATGISEGLVRISLGLEDVQDLLQDFTQALTQIA
jgi:cystathionine beta-lyase/cystathionine gamma-synthase